MKKLLLSILAVMAIGQTLQAESFFQEDDKQLHMACTTLISFVAAGWASENGYTESEAFWIGFSSAMFIGVLKEAYDARDGGSGFDGRDLLADGIGASLGSFTITVWKF